MLQQHNTLDELVLTNNTTVHILHRPKITHLLHRTKRFHMHATCENKKHFCDRKPCCLLHGIQAMYHDTALDPNNY